MRVLPLNSNWRGCWLHKRHWPSWISWGRCNPAWNQQTIKNNQFHFLHHRICSTNCNIKDQNDTRIVRWNEYTKKQIIAESLPDGDFSCWRYMATCSQPYWFIWDTRRGKVNYQEIRRLAGLSSNEIITYKAMQYSRLTRWPHNCWLNSLRQGIFLNHYLWL